MKLSSRLVAGCAATFLCAAEAPPEQDTDAPDFATRPTAFESFAGEAGPASTIQTNVVRRPAAQIPLEGRETSGDAPVSGADVERAATIPSIAPIEPDTLRTLTNGSRFLSPGRWSVQTRSGAMILSPPETGSHIVVADGGQADADAAVAAVWSLYRGPDAPAAVVGVQRRPREGWDETVLYRYQRPAGQPRDVFALALRKGERWTVLINDLTVSVSERRGAQLEVIFNSLLPEDYKRETFAGRQAHVLDAARISQLTDLIEIARREYDIPGVALGLIQDGEIVFAGGFGVREAGRPEPVDQDTLFNIASNGKALTTLMLAKLVEAGRFNWSTPVREIWPDFRLGDPAMSQRVQVGQLICACTGMPRQDLEYLFDEANSSAASIMRLLSTARPTSDFGDTYQYSNLMAAAAGFLGGHVLHPELELGSAYDKAMQDLVFDPLGMSATTADFKVALTGNHAAGHERDIDGRVSVADQGLNLMSISTRPSGNHWSSVRDLLRYIGMELAGGALPDGSRYIPEHILKQRQTPQVTEGLNEFYGMGLKIDRQWGVPVIHHGGSTAGYRSDMIWLPEHGVGAVILINSSDGVELRSAFRRRLLEVLFDGEPLAAKDMSAMAPRMRERAAQRRLALTVPADPEIVAQLAGQYASDELGHLSVRHVGGSTFLDFGGWRSEVATSRDDAGRTTLTTISPGTDGFEFTISNEQAGRRLVIRDADREYVFAERP